MPCDIISFSTVYRSYLDDGRVIMRAVLSGTYIQLKRFPPPAGMKTRTARSVGQRLTHRATGTPG